MAISSTGLLATPPSLSVERIPAAEKLRVAIVSDAIAGRNGVGTYYSDLIAYLRPKVGSMELIAPEQVADRTLEQFAIPMPGDASQRIIWPRLSELRRRLDAQQPNLIVIPTIGPLSYFAYRYARRRRIPFVLVNHTNFDQLLSVYFPRWVAAPLRRALSFVYDSAVRRATAVAAMSKDAFTQAQQLGVKMVRVMGTPISADFVQTPRPPRRPLRRVIFVGRLSAEKGLQELLAAAEQLPEFEFRIVGDGPLRGAVEQTVGRCGHVSFAGWLPREGVLAEMDQADLLILPSRLETFGTVALEALARQRYVLVRRECGIADWPTISPGLFMVEPRESIADAIRRLGEMPEASRDAIAERGWQAVADFNRYTLRLWLRFLVDTSGIALDGERPSGLKQQPLVNAETAD